MLVFSLKQVFIAELMIYGSSAAGLLFRRPEYTVEALNYLERCWDIYQAHCKVNPPPRDDKSMTCRELLWLFKVQQTHHKRNTHVLVTTQAEGFELRHE